MVLAIRKAFTFEDLPYKDFSLTQHYLMGFGLATRYNNSYIFAYPDIIDQGIRVTTSLCCAPERVYHVGCKEDISAASEELRSLVLRFLVKFTLHVGSEEIQW